MQDLSEKEYRAHEALSYSDLVWMDKSPLHFANRNGLRKESEAMRLGTLLHLGVLEPERFKNSYALEPEHIQGEPINRRVKAHREYLEQWKQQNEGKIFVRPEDMEILTSMFTALAAHKYAKKYLTGGISEVMAFGEYEGVPIKGRCDYIVEIPGLGKTVVDLKKTQDASPKGFARSIFNYNYQCQAWLYMHLFKADAFVWVAVEDSHLAPIGIYKANEELLEKGGAKIGRLINMYKQAVLSNHWRGYTEDATGISLPAWAMGDDNV